MIIIIVTIIAIIVKGSLPDFLVALVYVFFFWTQVRTDWWYDCLTTYQPSVTVHSGFFFFLFVLFFLLLVFLSCRKEERKNKTTAKNRTHMPRSGASHFPLRMSYICFWYVFFFVFLYFSRCLFVYYNIYFFFLCRKEGFRVELYILGGCK